MPHLFADISSHGMGHLGQVAPVLGRLRELLPELRLTLRSGLSEATLRSRIPGDFTHFPEASDFGFLMHDALRVDRAASAIRYRQLHADWPAAVSAEAAFQRSLAPDLVFSDVAYLPLAGAAAAGFPARAMSSLNWADLFAEFYGGEEWAAPIHRQMLNSYNSAAAFLRLTPGMPMPDLAKLRPLGPVAALGEDRQAELRERLACAAGERIVLLTFGGFDQALVIESWLDTPGLRWLLPASLHVSHPAATRFDSLGLPFTDLLRSVDAVLTKPGYGTFAEAACNGTPVLYLRREDWQIGRASCRGRV